MADPLSVTASVLAVATAAIVSVRSLHDTVKSLRGRNNTLRRLQAKLDELVTILEALTQVISADASILALLEGPIDRCKEICSEFEQLMKKFDAKSKTGLLDWTKLEFMKGDINEFIDQIEGYKSTITVGLGTINLRDSKISLRVLRQYEELIKDTVYNLEVRLQQIDDKLTHYNGQTTSVPDPIINLQDERIVTEQCLRICKDASSYIDALATRESAILKDTSRIDAGAGDKDFEAQMLMRRAFSKSQASFLEVIDRLGERLRSVIMDEGAENENERLKLQWEMDASKQCIQLCKMASEISHQKIHRIGEVVAEEDSDQVVVTTLADLFDVRRAVSKGRSAQLVATLTPENFDHVVEKRYSSRFGAVPDRSASSPIGSTASPPPKPSEQSAPSSIGTDAPAPKPEPRRSKPSPNEVKKRCGE